MRYHVDNPMKVLINGGKVDQPLVEAGKTLRMGVSLELTYVAHTHRLPLRLS